MVEALRRDPESTDAAETLRRRAREAGAYDLYAEAFEERGERLLEKEVPELAIESWFESALIFEENVQNLPRAAQVYQRILSVVPWDRRALFALGLVLYDQQHWDDLIALYKERLSRTDDDGERTTLQHYVAELLADKKDDPHGAFETLKEVAARSPWNLRILSRLEKLGERTGRIEEVVIAIGDMLLHQENPKIRAALSLRLGELHLGPIDDPQRALTYLRSALVDDGGNPEVIEEIEDFFRDRARFDQLAQFLEEAMKDRRIGPHRVRLERELARIYEYELEKPNLALQALVRALKLVPDDRDLIDEVLRLGLLAPDLELVANTYEALVRQTANPLMAQLLRLRLGQLYWEHLDSSEDARRIYEEILEIEPGHLEARRRLERLPGVRERSARPPSIVDPVLEVISHTEDLPRAADSFTSVGGDVDAVQRVGVAPEVNRTPPQTDDVDIFEHVVAEVESTSSVVAVEPMVLEESIQFLEGDERAQRRAHVARTWDALGEFSRAERVLRDGLMERAHDSELLEQLSQLLYQAKRWRDWLDIAGRQLELDPIRRTSIELRLQMVEVAREELGDGGLAWHLADEAAVLDSTDPRPLAVLEDLARTEGDFVALAQVLERVLVQRPRDVSVYQALGHAYRSAGQLDRAIAAFTSALDIEPDDFSLAWLLAELKLDIGDDDAAIRDFERLTQKGASSERARALVHLARLRFRKPNELERAKDALESALVLDPNCLDALALSYERAKAEGEHHHASTFAERCGVLDESPLSRPGWFRRAAEHADHGVGDVQRAIRLYKQALELDSDDPESEARLGRLLIERGDHSGARSHFLRAGRGVRDDLRAAELFWHAGRAAEASGAHHDALKDYDLVLSKVPQHREALARSGALYALDGNLQLAYDRSASLILHHDTSLTPSERAEAYRWMAVSKKADGDLQTAMRLASRAEEICPEDTHILSLLAELAEKTGQCIVAADILRRLAHHQKDRSQRVATLVRASGLLGQSQAADRARRIALLEAALDEAADDVSIAVKLAEARAEVGDKEGQADALEQGALHTNAAHKAELLVQASEVLHLIDRTRAVRVLQDAVNAVPDHPTAVERLEVMLAYQGDHAIRTDVLERAANAAVDEDPIASARWRLLAAHVAETHLNEPERALGILQEEGNSPRMADLLYRVAMTSGRLVERAREVWSIRCSESPGDGVALSRLADLYQRAGHEAAARFAFELADILYGQKLPEDAPTPNVIRASDGSDGSSDSHETSFLNHLGYTPLNAFSAELPTPQPRRRDQVQVSGLQLEIRRSIENAAEGLGCLVPPLFWQEGIDVPIAPGWALGGPCLLLSPPGGLHNQSTPRDEASLRFYVGRSLSLLRAGALSLHLLPVDTLRAVAYGLAERSPLEGDPVSQGLAKKRGRAVLRRLPAPARSEASRRARAWLDSPRRSLSEARNEMWSAADQWGLLASGSPGTAVGIVSERSALERSKLLRFAVKAAASLGPSSTIVSTLPA